MKQTLSMHFFSRLLTTLSLILILGSTAFGQTEAQAGEDILILQKQGSSNSSYLRVGDEISYPVEQGGVLVDHKGEIVSIDEDGLVLQKGKKGEQVKVDLDELPYWRRHRPTMLTFGWILTVLGAAFKLLLLIGLIITLATAAGSEFVGLAILIFILGLFLDPFSGLALAGGIMLVSAGRKKISKPKWSWRKGKLMIKKALSRK